MGEAFKSAESAREKIDLVARLNILASQDAGGLTFMTGRLHDQVAGAGLTPGLSAVFSLLVQDVMFERYKIPEIHTRRIDIATYEGLVLGVYLFD